MKRFWETIYRSPDEPAAGGDSSGGSGGAAGGAGAGGGAGDGLAAAPAAAPAPASADGQQQQAAPAVYFPEGLDAKFKGETEKATLDNLAKHLAELPKPPDKPEAYTFTPSDQLKPFLSGEMDDKVLGIFRGAAHKAGLSQPQFEGAINSFYGEMIAAGLVSPPVDVDQHFSALGGTDGTPAERIAKGERRVLDLRDTVNGLSTAGHLTAQEAAGLIGSFASPETVIAIEKLVALIPGAKGPQGGGAGGGQTVDTHQQAIARLYPSMVRQAS